MRTADPAADDKQTSTVDLSNPANHKGRLKRVGGSQSDHWNSVLINQVAKTLWVKYSDKDMRDQQCNATVAALIGIGPNDEIEGMLAAQMIATHNAAMECFRRAMLGEQTFEGRNENLNQANKLSRTYTMLLDSLNRHRGKVQQKVTVEHVHVHSGGRAVVGTVETSGGGGHVKFEDQSHARQIAHAPQPAMWSANKDKEWEPVPRASVIGAKIRSGSAARTSLASRWSNGSPQSNLCAISPILERARSATTRITSFTAIACRSEAGVADTPVAIPGSKQR
jgi:hypothetical protein